MLNRLDSDGHPKRRLRKMDSHELVGTFMSSLHGLGLEIHNRQADFEALKDPMQDEAEFPQGFRYTSWVEKPRSKYGHFFSVNEVSESGDPFDGDITIIGMYHRVRRGIKSTPPKQIDLKVASISCSDMAIDKIEGLTNNFRQRELMFSISMLGKMHDALKTGLYLPRADDRIVSGVSQSFETPEYPEDIIAPQGAA